jgi:hypothetical protein
MGLHAPHVALFYVAAFLSIVGILCYLSFSIPGLAAESAAWLIFLGWFLLAAGTALPLRKS